MVRVCAYWCEINDICACAFSKLRKSCDYLLQKENVKIKENEKGKRQTRLLRSFYQPANTDSKHEKNSTQSENVFSKSNISAINQNEVIVTRKFGVKQLDKDQISAIKR